MNADFDRPAVVHAGRLEWVPSPMKGVDRRMLDRIGDEVARATSIVRYAPDSRFSPHVHGGGEEFLVLEGTFQDEHGDFPAGTYVRNPPTSSHRPRSDGGCTIFVKLWQFDPDDRMPVIVDTAKAPTVVPADRPGVTVAPLYRDRREDVRLETWAPGARIRLDAPGGIEVLTLSGGFAAEGETFAPQSWLRLPCGGKLDAAAGPQGARVWIKAGHLRETPRAPTV